MPPLRRGRDYTLSSEQPILRRNRRRRKRAIDAAVAEKAFWSNFPLEKLCWFGTLPSRSLPLRG